MKFSKKILPEQKIIGIATRADNSAEGMKKIGELWQKFYGEEILARIPGKLSEEIFAVYTDYEKDYTKPYTLIIGAKVSNNVKTPQTMFEHIMPKQEYAVFAAKGLMPKAIIGVWNEIWASNIKRTYSSDFEFYNEKSNQGDNSEVQIYIAIQ